MSNLSQNGKSNSKKICSVCGIKLKAFERIGLCSCSVTLCIKHSNRSEHECVNGRTQESLPPKVAGIKVSVI